jgi:transcriptional regulator with XRE-family HTH domain
MEEILLGEVIKNRRKELGLTQGQLCEGICSFVTISRIEAGTQTPRRNVMLALLQRLGLPSDRFFGFVSKNEEKVDKLQKDIVFYNTRHDSENGLIKLKELEEITEDDDIITKQFILRTKVILGNQDGQYSFEERIDMLMEAIHMTVPRFNLDEINSLIYTFDEVKIINQIALTYSRMGEHKKAVDIYRQLLKYIQNRYQNILQSGGLLPLVSHNYAQELSLCKRYEEAIEIAELGWKSCIMYGHYQQLPGVISIMAECYFYLDQQEKSVELYRQAYYVYMALGDSKNTERVQNEMMEHLGVTI